MFPKAVRQSSPCFAYVDLLTWSAGYAIDDIYGSKMHVQRSVILADRFGPKILAMLEIKGQSCACTYKSSQFVFRLKCAPNQKVTYVFVAFE